MEDNAFRLSRFTHFLPIHADYTAVYNSLNLGVFFVRNEVSKVLQSFAEPQSKYGFYTSLAGYRQGTLEPIIDRMISWRMLIASDGDNLQDYKTIQADLNNLPIGILYLLLTDRCNLGCGYCFVEGGLPEDYVFSNMAPGVAKQGIDLYARAHSANHPDAEYETTIIFYGGEPLINWRTIRFAVEYVEQLKKGGQLPQDTRITMNTNAVLITKQMAEYFAKHEVGVSVSLDGPQAMHDEARPYQSGLGSFEHVMRGYQLLKDAGVQASISCTISEANLASLKDVLIWFIDELGIEGLGFSMLIDIDTMMVKDHLGYSEKASRALIECFEIAREKGIYEDRMMRKVKSFVDGKIYPNDCGGCGQQIVVAPTGEIGVCQGFVGTKDYFVENTDNFLPNQHPFWTEWRQRSPLTMPQCIDCVALGICGGGCPRRAYLRHGSIWELDDAFCVHAKATLNWLIKELFQNTIAANGVGTGD